MHFLVAFLTGTIVTLLEIIVKYKRAPRLAVTNPWAITLMLLNGLASAVVFYFVQDVEVLSLNFSDPILKALIIGLEWQALLRSKVLSGEGPKGQEIQVGFEYLYRRYTHIFEYQIEQREETQVLSEIHKWKGEQGITDQEARERAIGFINYEEVMKKISEAEARERKEKILSSDVYTIMYTVFEMSSLNTLREVFSEKSGALGAGAPQPSSYIRITHIEYNPQGTDVEGEHVIIRNNGASPIELAGWTLSDKVNHTFTFPPFVLSPGASVKVWTGKGSDSTTDLYWGMGSAVWNNIADTATLKSADGEVVDRFSYAGEK